MKIEVETSVAHHATENEGEGHFSKCFCTIANFGEGAFYLTIYLHAIENEGEGHFSTTFLCTFGVGQCTTTSLSVDVNYGQV